MNRCPVPEATRPPAVSFLIAVALSFFLVGTPSPASAQEPVATKPPLQSTVAELPLQTATEGLAQGPAHATLQADPQDVESVNAIVAAIYDVISGPAGEPRDWERWTSLFLPGARLVSVNVNPQGATTYRTMTPQEYAERAGPAFAQTGFFESEIGRTEEAFGPVVQLFSAYASRRSPEDPAPFARGINSFQLMHDGSRWWIVSIFWTAERPDLPIPERYLGAASGGLSAPSAPWAPEEALPGATR